MPWSFDQTTPIYIQIADRLREMIVRGSFGRGEKLPSVRDLSYDSSANPNTVQRAFTLLEEEGLVVTEGTQGRRVTDNEEILSAARGVMVRELVGDFVARLASLGYSAADGAKMVESFDLYKEENANAKHDS